MNAVLCVRIKQRVGLLAYLKVGTTAVGDAEAVITFSVTCLKDVQSGLTSLISVDFLHVSQSKRL